MKLFGIEAAVATVLAVAVVAVSTPTRAEEKKDSPTVSEIMKKAHGKAGILGDLKGAVPKKGEPKFDVVKEKSAELLPLAEALAKASPKKGEKASWDKLTKSYVDNVKSLVDAAENKDAPATSKAMTALGSTCGGCHSKHK